MDVAVIPNTEPIAQCELCDRVSESVRASYRADGVKICDSHRDILVEGEGATVGEHVYATEALAEAARSTFIADGYGVSLLGYDGCRGLFIFDVISAR